MTYTIMRKLCPDNFLERYKPMSSVSSGNTRNSQNLKTPSYAVEHCKKSFHYLALNDWNDTPINLRELPSPNTFKRQLEKYLKSKT